MENQLCTKILILTLLGRQKGYKLARMFSATKLSLRIFPLLLVDREHQYKTIAIGFAQKYFLKQKL